MKSSCFFSENIEDKCPESFEQSSGWVVPASMLKASFGTATGLEEIVQLEYVWKVWVLTWNRPSLCATKTNILQCCQLIKSHLSSNFCLLILIEGGKLLNIRTAFCNSGGNLCITTPKVLQGKRNSEWNVINFLWKNGKLYDWHLMCCWTFHTDFILTPPCVNEEDDCNAIPFPFHICILLCDVWNLFPWIYWWYFFLRIWARRRCSQEVSWCCWKLFYLEITCCFTISKPHVLDQQKFWLQAKQNKISNFCWNCNKHRTWASQGQTFHRRAENASFPGCLYQWLRAACSVHDSQGTQVTTHFDFSFPLVPLEDVAPECLHHSFCCSFSPAYLASQWVNFQYNCAIHANLNNLKREKEILYKFF